MAAPTYPRTFPSSPAFKKQRLGINYNELVDKSPYVNVKRIEEGIGHRWEGSLTLPPMSTDDARVWKAWLASMDGGIGTFYAYDTEGRASAGAYDSGLDTPLVDGASQTGSSLLIKGFRVAGIADVLAVGDYFEVNGELKLVVEATTAAAGGGATIVFEPKLRASPADNDPLTITNAKGVFVIPDDFTEWQSDEFGIHDFTFPIEEDV